MQITPGAATALLEAFAERLATLDRATPGASAFIRTVEAQLAPGGDPRSIGLATFGEVTARPALHDAWRQLRSGMQRTAVDLNDAIPKLNAPSTDTARAAVTQLRSVDRLLRDFEQGTARFLRPALAGEDALAAAARIGIAARQARAELAQIADATPLLTARWS